MPGKRPRLRGAAAWRRERADLHRWSASAAGWVRGALQGEAALHRVVPAAAPTHRLDFKEKVAWAARQHERSGK